MNRIDRLFGILTLLQSKKYVTAEKIAENFKLVFDGLQGYKSTWRARYSRKL